MVNEFAIVLKKAKEQYEGWAKELEKRLKVAPVGSLEIEKRGKKVAYYRYFRLKKKKIYMSAKKIDVVKRLAQKDYDRKKLKILRQEINLIKKLVELEENSEYDVYSNLSPERQKLVTTLVQSDEDFIAEWLKGKKHFTNPYPKTKPIPTNSGDEVRSLAEQTRDNKLLEHNVVFAYEPAVQLPNRVVYADFIILNKYTRKEYVFEHFGKIDDDDYYGKMQNKLADYINGGYYMGVNFFSTFATKADVEGINLFDALNKNIFDARPEGNELFR